MDYRLQQLGSIAHGYIVQSKIKNKNLGHLNDLLFVKNAAVNKTAACWKMLIMRVYVYVVFVEPGNA